MQVHPSHAIHAGLLAVVTLTLLGAAPALAQETADLVVVVTAAETGKPLPGAQLRIQGTGIGASADNTGRVRLEGLLPGSRVVEARYLGYAPAWAAVRLGRGGTANLSLALRIQPVALAEVRVRSRRSLLQERGFHLRKASGFGTFITREQIERMQVRRLSDVLRRVAGLSLSSSSFGGVSRARSRGTKVLGSCPIQYYLDGTLTSLYNVDEIQPSDIEGLEVYRGAATVPLEFNKGTAMCGVILIWTRNQ